MPLQTSQNFGTRNNSVHDQNAHQIRPMTVPAGNEMGTHTLRGARGSVDPTSQRTFIT